MTDRVDKCEILKKFRTIRVADYFCVDVEKENAFRSSVGFQFFSTDYIYSQLEDNFRTISNIIKYCSIFSLGE